MAIIQKSVEVKDELAPFVVSFSSRGPNPITSDILKVILLINFLWFFDYSAFSLNYNILIFCSQT